MITTSVVMAIAKSLDKYSKEKGQIVSFDKNDQKSQKRTSKVAEPNM